MGRHNVKALFKTLPVVVLVVAVVAVAGGNCRLATMVSWPH